MSAVLRPCTGCRRLIPAGRRECRDCARARWRRIDAARGTPAERGYGADHRALRREAAPLVASGTARCARCGLPIAPGQAWDLGHTDDRTGWSGPEHAGCNRAAAMRIGNARRADRRRFAGDGSDRRTRPQAPGERFSLRKQPSGAVT